MASSNGKVEFYNVPIGNYKVSFVGNGSFKRGQLSFNINGYNPVELKHLELEMVEEANLAVRLNLNDEDLMNGQLAKEREALNERGQGGAELEKLNGEIQKFKDYAGSLKKWVVNVTMVDEEDADSISIRKIYFKLNDLT